MAQWIEGDTKWRELQVCFLGVPSESFVDATCCNQVPYRSLADAQAHVLAGVHGRRKNCQAIQWFFCP